MIYNIGLFCFFVAQVAYPIVYMIFNNDSPDAFSQTLIAPLSLAAILIAYSQKLTFKQLLRRQVNFILGYFLSGMIVYFHWHLQKLKGKQNTFQSIVAYISFMLVNFVYSLVSHPELNNKIFTVMIVCSGMRILYYTWLCMIYILKTNYDPVMKDIRLIVQATLITMYSMYIERLVSAWQSSKKVDKQQQSLLLSEQ